MLTSLHLHLRKLGSELTEIFNVARVNVLNGIERSESANEILASKENADEVTIRVRRSTRHKCPRCRTFRKERESDRLCQRCQAVVDGLHA